MGPSLSCDRPSGLGLSRGDGAMVRRLPVVDPVMRVQAQLTDRDCVLLEWLAEHGVLTSFQIAQAVVPVAGLRAGAAAQAGRASGAGAVPAEPARRRLLPVPLRARPVGAGGHLGAAG